MRFLHPLTSLSHRFLASRALLRSLALAAATDLALPALAAAFDNTGGTVAPVTTAPGGAAAATNPAGAENGSLTVTVLEVKGMVQVRTDEKAAWAEAKAGMVVDEGAEFRTAPRSWVRCMIPPDQTFVLDRLGTMKVLQAIRSGNKVRTDLLMKYGRTKYTIEGAGLEHESTIASPSSTLAVRGTSVSVYDQPPFTPEAVSYTGRAVVRNAQRQVAFGGKGAGTTRVKNDKGSPAETALAQSVTDPRFSLARTNSEDNFIASQVARGGVISFDPLTNVTVLRGTPPIANDLTLAQSLPGQLQFVARWNGPADVSVEVFTQFGDPQKVIFSPKGFQPTDYLFPGFGLNNSAGGGKIPFDDRGGPQGGTEFAYFNNAPSQAVFLVPLTNASGPPVDVKLNAFLNGKKQFLFFPDPVTGRPVKSLTLELTLKQDQFTTPFVFLPPLKQLENVFPTVGDGSDAGGTTPTAIARKRAADNAGRVASGPAATPAANPAPNRFPASLGNVKNGRNDQPASRGPAAAVRRR